MVRICYTKWEEKCEGCELKVECDKGLAPNNRRCNYEKVSCEFDVDRIIFKINNKEVIKEILLCYGTHEPKHLPPSLLKEIKILGDKRGSKNVILARKSRRKAKVYKKDINCLDKFEYEIIEDSD